MTPEQKAAYLIATSVAAYAEIEGMKTANIERKNVGASPAYNEQNFYSVIHKNGLHSSAIITFFLD